MDLKGKKIILASGSPRRHELLKGLDVDFTIDTGDSFVESCDPSLPAKEIPILMSEGKSKGFHRELTEDEILVTSDTMVICQGHAIGKPHGGRQAAIEMLKGLAGKMHTVVTAVTFRTTSRMKTVTDETNVYFKALSDSEIEYYVDHYSPYDKAGSYGAQDWFGYVAITRIEGSYFNVMGLPVHKVYELLREFVG